MAQKNSNTKLNNNKKNSVEQNIVKDSVTEDIQTAESPKGNGLTEKERELRQKYQDKFIKDTKKDKKMGLLFWLLLAGCVAMIIFTITIIIVRS